MPLPVSTPSSPGLREPETQATSSLPVSSRPVPVIRRPGRQEQGHALAPRHCARRCAAAVRALLERGADPLRKNGNGSTPIDLGSRNTGRGGTGSPEAKAPNSR